ncbi:hypothetical protein GGI13_008190, partial [Coemansia sp. RSA 455]
VPTGSDQEMLSQSTVADGADMDVCEVSPPNPYADGIYALSLADRRKLGLDDDDSLATVPNGVWQGHAEPDVNIYVGGRPKAISSITSDDEGEMSIKEYTEYWNIWHRSQSA